MTEALIIIPSIIAVWLGIERYSAWRHRRREERDKAIKEWVENNANYFLTQYLYDVAEEQKDQHFKDSLDLLMRSLSNVDTKDTHVTIDPKQLTDNLPKN